MHRNLKTFSIATDIINQQYQHQISFLYSSKCRYALSIEIKVQLTNFSQIDLLSGRWSHKFHLPLVHSCFLVVAVVTHLRGFLRRAFRHDFVGSFYRLLYYFLINTSFKIVPRSRFANATPSIPCSNPTLY